jgi:hypothetical protein
MAASILQFLTMTAEPWAKVVKKTEQQKSIAFKAKPTNPAKAKTKTESRSEICRLDGKCESSEMGGSCWGIL